MPDRLHGAAVLQRERGDDSRVLGAGLGSGPDLAAVDEHLGNATVDGSAAGNGAGSPSAQATRPAVTGYRVCRMHGARGGALEGEQNGNFRHGGRTKEAIEASRYMRELLRLVRGLD